MANAMGPEGVRVNARPITL
ncbi:hypothetical protein ACUODJ_07470 [Escherichia sp. HC-CC]